MSAQGKRLITYDEYSNTGTDLFLMSFMRVSCAARVVPYTAKQGLFGNAFTSARATVGFVSLTDVVVSSSVWFFLFAFFTSLTDDAEPSLTGG